MATFFLVSIVKIKLYFSVLDPLIRQAIEDSGSKVFCCLCFSSDPVLAKFAIFKGFYLFFPSPIEYFKFYFQLKGGFVPGKTTQLLNFNLIVFVFVLVLHFCFPYSR